MTANIAKRFLIPGLAGAHAADEKLEKHLRDAIISGRLREGTRLPNTLPWAKALGVNDRRVQHALARLAAQGFLERRPRVGTYVRRRQQRPKVVILVGWPLVTEHFHYIRKIIEILMENLRAKDYDVEVLDNLFALLTNNLSEKQILVSQVRDRLLSLNPAGYIECTFDLSRLPDLYPSLKRPLVTFGSNAGPGDVYIDDTAGLRASMRYLASKGRRKIILLRSTGRLTAPHRATDVFWKFVEEFGFVRGTFQELYHSSITDSMERESYHWMLQLIESWKGLRKNYVPDSLIVTDDVMMRGVAAALIKSGIKIPEDLLVVTKGNEGIRFVYGIPVVRCEISLREVALNLVDLLIARIEKRPGIKHPLVVSRTKIIE